MERATMTNEELSTQEQLDDLARYVSDEFADLNHRIYRQTDEQHQREQRILQLIIVAVYCFVLGRIGAGKKDD